MKILFVVDSYVGGAGNVIQLLARHFRDLDNEVTIALLNGKRTDPKYELSNIKQIDHPLGVHVKTHTPIDRVYKYTTEVKKLFDEEEPDVIISFLTQLNILCCFANNRRVPIIVSERNDPRKDSVRAYWKVLKRLAYSKADRIVVQCSSFLDSFPSFSNRVTVIPNPIRCASVEYDTKAEIDCIKLVSMGRLCEQKNYYWMIDIAELLNIKGVEFVLDIYGNGDLDKELISYIKKKNLGNRVFLKGYAYDVDRVLSEYDVYLMTSDYEGFPNSLSEAMAVGLPSVSRLCHEGIRDLVRDNENGFVVSIENKALFVKRIIEIKEDAELRKRISDNAKHVVNEFSIEAIAKMWKTCIDDVI